MFIGLNATTTKEPIANSNTEGFEVLEKYYSLKNKFFLN